MTDANLIFNRPVVTGAGQSQTETCSVELLGLAIYGSKVHGYSLPCIDGAAQRVVVNVNDRLSDEAKQTRRWRLIIARLGQCHRTNNVNVWRRMALWSARHVEHLATDPAVKACNDATEAFLAGEITRDELLARRGEARVAVAYAVAAAAAAAYAAAVAAAVAAAYAAADAAAAAAAAAYAAAAAAAAAAADARDQALMDFVEAYLDQHLKVAADEGEAITPDDEAEYVAFVDQLDALLAGEPA